MATPQQMLATPRGRAVLLAAIVLVVGVIAIAVVATGRDDAAAPASSAATSTTRGSAASTTSGSAATLAPAASPAASPAVSPIGATTVPATAGTTTPTAPVATTVPASAAPPTTGVPPSPASMVTVPVDTLATVPPVGIDDVGDFGTGLTIEVVGIEAIEGEARLPGEISGPSLRIELRATNGSTAPVSLAHTQVDLRYGADATPGVVLTGSGADPFEGEIAADDSATGIYVFGVPTDQRDLIQLLVTYDVTAPIVIFEGPANA